MIPALKTHILSLLIITSFYGYTLTAQHSSQSQVYFKIEGKVLDMYGNPMEGVDIYIDNPFLLEFPRQYTTDENGNYRIKNLPLGHEFTVFARKRENRTKEISTLDYVLIIRHMLGLQNHLHNPYRIIAADTNTDNKLTHLDLVDFKNVILGVYPKFPGVETIRFVNEAYVFPDPKNPWQEEDGQPYRTKLKPQGDIEFNLIGIRLGKITK